MDGARGRWRIMKNEKETLSCFPVEQLTDHHWFLTFLPDYTVFARVYVATLRMSMHLAQSGTFLSPIPIANFFATSNHAISPPVSSAPIPHSYPKGPINIHPSIAIAEHLLTLPIHHQTQTPTTRYRYRYTTKHLTRPTRNRRNHMHVISPL